MRGILKLLSVRVLLLTLVHATSRRRLAVGAVKTNLGGLVMPSRKRRMALKDCGTLLRRGPVSRRFSASDSQWARFCHYLHGTNLLLKSLISQR